MRRSLMKMKLCLIALLCHYKVVPGEHFVDNFQILDGHSVQQTKAILVKREKHSLDYVIFIF